MTQNATNGEVKKIQLTLGKICNGSFTPALGKLASLPFLSGKDAYALARTLDILNPELRAYESARTGLVKKHGKTSDNLTWQVLPTDKEAWEKFSAELKELQDKEVALFLDHKIRLPELTTMHEFQLAVIELKKSIIPGLSPESPLFQPLKDALDRAMAQLNRALTPLDLLELLDVVEMT